jgi:glycyl-tRNA synthetase beta chain
MAEYFFELLTEEIPAWMHGSFTTPVQTALQTLVAELGSGTFKIDSTPRRLSIFLRDLPLREEDREQEVKGPPKKTAYGADGAPTPALHGFLKKQNATVDDVLESGDEYVRIKRKIAGRDVADILRERIPNIVESIRWPKMMRVGRGEYAYIRPVHSVVSVFEEQHLPIAIFGMQSGTSTVGHRTLAPKKIEVKSYLDYKEKLELAHVVVESERREFVMAQRALVLAKDVGGAPTEDASIVAQWKFLTEYPGLVRAEFRRDYLALPEEVLVTVMRVHQKQLPIRDRDGRLTNSFLAVLDNTGDPEGHAAYGNSFVTNARFADAQFFYETDRRRKLEERSEQLAHLQFQEKLGNYADKTKRIRAIVAKLGGDADALRAAELCKSDLVTEMVKEFTELQGKIGGIYAREEGLPATVWQAIYDHYLPANIDDPLPRNRAGALLSIADRIDTLAGFFSLGLKPTGSKDPFGLRRAAQGIVQILLNRDIREVKVSIAKLIDVAMEVYGQQATGNVKDDLLAFFADRVSTILQASAWQFEYDEIRAVMEAGWADVPLTDLVDRANALKALRDDPNFLSILDSAKRIANITAGHTATRVDAARLEHASEKRLAELADAVTTQIDEMISERQYRPALESFAALAPELETFFQDVMVMVDDEAVRTNRMSLLRNVGGAVMRIADVTKIVVDRRDYRP